MDCVYDSLSCPDGFQKEWGLFPPSLDSGEIKIPVLVEIVNKVCIFAKMFNSNNRYGL